MSVDPVVAAHDNHHKLKIEQNYHASALSRESIVLSISVLSKIVNDFSYECENQ